jgi:hypothetical protein
MYVWSVRSRGSDVTNLPSSSSVTMLRDRASFAISTRTVTAHTSGMQPSRVAAAIFNRLVRQLAPNRATPPNKRCAGFVPFRLPLPCTASRLCSCLQDLSKVSRSHGVPAGVLGPLRTSASGARSPLAPAGQKKGSPSSAGAGPRAHERRIEASLERFDRHLAELDHACTVLQAQRAFDKHPIVQFDRLLTI